MAAIDKSPPSYSGLFPAGVTRPQLAAAPSSSRAEPNTYELQTLSRTGQDLERQAPPARSNGQSPRQRRLHKGMTICIDFLSIATLFGIIAVGILFVVWGIVLAVKL